ncbi:MAG: hypothetical protein KA146_08845 [Leptospiraceae bacterium]|nr:hypothetical protein [Leptospiraceae bacterium]
MKLILQIFLVCSFIYCSNAREEKEKARRNYFLCVFIVREAAIDTQMAVAGTLSCTFKYPEAFDK